MTQHWADVWDGTVDEEADDFLVSARTASASSPSSPAASSPDEVHEVLLRELLALRREQSQRATMTLVGGLLLAAATLSYVDSLQSQLRQLREAVARRETYLR